MTDDALTFPVDPPKHKRTRAEYVMYGLGFSSGLPFALLSGSLGVWLTNAGLSFGTIGALSWIGLFYAFKFIWAPMFDWIVPPFASTVGRRKAWIAICQVTIVVCLFGMTFIDPRSNILMFAMLGVAAAFASASQDIVIDAWRIETAEDSKTLDRMSVQYQMGYRLAALLAGAAALLLTDMWRTVADPAAGWPPTVIILSVMMSLSLIATYFAPEPVFRPPVDATGEMSAETKQLRSRTAIPVAAGWAISAAILLGFMFYSLGNPSASFAVFRDAATPWILLLTIGAPLAVSFWLAQEAGRDRGADAAEIDPGCAVRARARADGGPGAPLLAVGDPGADAGDDIPDRGFDLGLVRPALLYRHSRQFELGRRHRAEADRRGDDHGRHRAGRHRRHGDGADVGAGGRAPCSRRSPIFSMRTLPMARRGRSPSSMAPASAKCSTG